MSGLKMVKGKAVTAKVGAKAIVATKKIVVAKKKLDDVDTGYDGPVTSASKGSSSAPAGKAVKAAKVPKEKKEKVLRVTRTGRMGEYLMAREFTDVEIYEKLDAEFGEGKKYLATYRHNLNVAGLEKDPKFKPLVRLIRGQDGTIGEFVKGEKSAKKEKREEKKAKITLAISKLPKK
jgi:hypothetical protein